MSAMAADLTPRLPKPALLHLQIEAEREIDGQLAVQWER
jgi:hypothetical protein